MIHRLGKRSRKPPVDEEAPKPAIRIKNSGIAPEWKELPRRRCANCGRRYQPVRPEQRFCRTAKPGDPDHCRNQFKRHGGAFHKLLPIIEREIAERTAELSKRLEALEKQALKRQK